MLLFNNSQLPLQKGKVIDIKVRSNQKSNDMKKLVAIILFALVTIGLEAQETKKVFGTVSDGTNPMEDVTVTVLDKNVSTSTGTDGQYEIQVEIGDKLQFSYTGMRTVTIKVEDVTRILNPVMIPDITELNEVEVKASRRRSQAEMAEDYNTNKSIIRTAWGYLDADRAAGRIRMLDEDEINAVSLCVLNLLQRFPGVQTIGNCSGTGGAVIIRGLSSFSNSNAAIFDVDGQIFTDVPWWVDINNIKRIAVLYGLSTTVQYGGLAQGGVVVINTIGGSPTNSEIVDRARLRNNYADGSELSREEVAKNAPTYLKELRAGNSFEESKAIFESYHATYSNSPYFLLDAYTHFVEEHNEDDYADGIIEEHFDSYRNNAVLMKALAYTYESQGRYEKANQTYKEIFILRPNYVQSYMDMANSYRDLDEPRQAASMHARYGYLVNEGFLEQDTVGFAPIMEREFNNLLMLNKGAVIDGRKAQKLFVAEEDFEGTRLVFEWNDGEAEFELQFVNPENQYHKFKHSLADNAEVIALEKDFGYNVKEYLVDGALPGTWQVNVKYLGNKSLTPAYLKATVYYGYGTRAQRKETMVFKLDLKKVNQELFQFLSSAKVVVK